MVTLAPTPSDPTVAKRLPRPDDMQYFNLPLSPAEVKQVEDAAHSVRLSVASFLRVVVVESCENPERLAAWEAVAARLAKGGDDAPPKKRGRPRKDGGKG